MPLSVKTYVVLWRNAANRCAFTECRHRELIVEKSAVVANCIAHGRRRFVEVAAKFPEECRYVLETLGKVYKHDAFCLEQGMSPEERLVYHQTHSGPRMKELEQWFQEVIKTFVHGIN